MPSRPSWFWTSFFSSIGVNAVLLTSSACWLYSQTKIYLPGYARSEILEPIYVDAPPPQLPDTMLGDSAGKGDAADATAGDAPMESRLGKQVQSFMSRDPEGPGKIDQDPSMSTQIPGENGSGGEGSPAMFGAATPAEPELLSPPTPKFSSASEFSLSQEMATATTPPMTPTLTPPMEMARPEAPPTELPPTDAPPSTVPPTEDGLKRPEASQNGKKDVSEVAKTSDDKTDQAEKVQEPDSRQDHLESAGLRETALASLGDMPNGPAISVAHVPAPTPQASVTPTASATPSAPAATPAGPSPQSTPKPPAAQASPTESSNASRSQSAGGGKPGPNVAPADPAPQTDSESDPFSKEGAVKFKRGSTDVQFGRQHKIIRPRLGLAAQTDMLNLRDPITLVLALTLDDTGKVIRVEVLKTSGSHNIDQACKVAAYQWWLEPTKDKSGKPIKDVVPFVIGFS
jgi:hypothetical protein